MKNVTVVYGKFEWNHAKELGFTRRKSRVRIIGAGYWRKGKKFYEKENA